MIGFETYITGTHEEPMLNVDGDILVKTLESDAWLTAREAGLSREEERSIDAAVEAELIRLTDAYAPELSQEIIEAATDAAYEAYKDREL